MSGLEFLVSPVITSLIRYLASSDFNEINRVLDVNIDMTKLSKTLTNIQAVLYDAEKMQLENKLVGNWLRELKDIAYDAEDILDGFQYEALRRRMEIHGRLRKKVKTFFSISNPVGFRLRMAYRIRSIHQKLDGITKGMDTFKFLNIGITSTDTNTRFKTKVNSETSSLVDGSKIVGRDLDMSKIKYLLTNSSSNQQTSSVVRIVGIGGIGKTTLAQMIFNDESVANHFSLKSWICVSQSFSGEKEVYSKLLESIKVNKSDISSLETMVNRFKESFGSKRYLIVLDDVWDDGYINWEKVLTDLLFIGGEGSKILMTTRGEPDIPSIMGSLYTYRLPRLTESKCWLIFEKIAFGPGGVENTATMIQIGKKIVKKCGGLPLAAKVLGGLMYSKKQEDEWSSIQNDEVWNLPEGEKIMGVLKLSYGHLTSYLKRCLSYCSVLPKDGSIERKKLIRLWMAEGFLNNHISDNKSAETVGNEYFNILLVNSFFQDEQRNEWGEITTCKMHGLVHDLALSVLGSELSIGSGSTSKFSGKDINRLRHMLYDNEIGSEVYTALKLRTLVPFSNYSKWNIWNNIWEKKLLNLLHLRVLDLSDTQITKLPSSICNMKSLRYFDLSSTSLKSLPNSFTKLYNLQTLRLKRCPLVELPKDIRQLSNLRYLIFREFGIVEMPQKVSELSQLQKLSAFVVGKGSGFGIEELKDLNLLGGKLQIRNLENVTDATTANLKEKKNIRCLELYWGLSHESHDNAMEDAVSDAVLDGLKPHQHLRKLRIFNFGGTKFPTWLSSPIHLPYLVSVNLRNCGKCTILPSLGRLKCLKYLELYNMSAVKSIGPEFYGSSEEASFPSLLELVLCRMDSLEEWIGDDQLSSSSSCFPCLEKLTIRYCSKLTTTPTLFPSLKVLVFVGSCSLFSAPPITNNSASLFYNFRGLQYLTIKNCPNLKSLPDGLQYLPALEKMVLGGFSDELEYFPFPAIHDKEYFPSLHELEILGWSNLKYLPVQLQYFTSLQDLTINEFPSLKKLPEALGNLSSLRTLKISNCDNLKYLPSREQMLGLTLLRELTIWGCPILEKRCLSGNEEWHKIAHLKFSDSSWREKAQLSHSQIQRQQANKVGTRDIPLRSRATSLESRDTSSGILVTSGYSVYDMVDEREHHKVSKIGLCCTPCLITK